VKIKNISNYQYQNRRW